MKKCPKCNRTYADDGFTFCLEDGALLSAPYDPKEKPISTIQSGGPPPTAVMPDDIVRSPDKESVPPPPTIASPDPLAEPQKVKPILRPQFDVPTTPAKKFKLAYIAITFLSLLIVGGVSLYNFSSSQCSKLNVSVRCLPSKDSALCAIEATETQSSTGPSRPIISSFLPIAAFQAANPAPAEIDPYISKTNWTISSGKIAFKNKYYTEIDTTGLAGRQITVTATAISNHWFCSKTASTSFIVPSASP